MDDFNDLLSSEEILGGGAGVEDVKQKHSPTIQDLAFSTTLENTKASTGSGKRSNAKDLEEQHKKAIEKFDDGFEDLLQGLQEQIELLNSQLRGGNSEIRKPKLPVKVFLRFHMEEYNLVKMRKPEWTTSQITQSLKKRWIGMSDAQKERYIESYDKDMKKYDSLMMHFNRLTQKPKKPVTPYFQFYTEYLPTYKMNYPLLSLNEVTKLIGRDWSNFDSKKKAELNREYERQKVIYTKQVKAYESNSNDYTRVNDYLSKVEDYEKELEEELETLRQKHPKPPSAAEVKRKESKLKLEEARKLRQERSIAEIRARKLNKLKQKEQTAVLDKPQLPPTFIKGIPDNAIPKVIQPIKKPAAVTSNNTFKADTQKSASTPRIEVEKKPAAPFDLDQELKDARSSNGKQARLRSSTRQEEQQPQLRKLLRRNDGTGAVKVVATRNSTSVPSKSQTRLQARQEEKKKQQQQQQSLKLKRTKSSSKVIETTKSASSRSVSKKEKSTKRSASIVEESPRRSRRSQRISEKEDVKSKGTSRSRSSKLVEKKQVKNGKQIPIKKSERSASNRSTATAVTKSAKNSSSSSSNTPAYKTRRNADEKDQAQGMSVTRSKKTSSSATHSPMIKYMLGMRNGDETEYLVLFEDGKQRWTREDDAIFKNERNGVKLHIFLRQLKEKQK